MTGPSVSGTAVDDPGVRQDVAVPDHPKDLPEIELLEPMAGFPDRRRFVLVDVDGAGLLQSLRSLDDPELRFLVMAPGVLFPDYAPDLDDSWAARLGLTGPQDAQVLLVVTPGADPREATANLLAPVVLNVNTRVAAQVVLHADLPLRAPLARPA